MEYAKQALVAPDGIRERPEKSVSSSSGKNSRTGEECGCPWELLPDEMVVSIFSLLSNEDLLACRAVCKRFVLVIGDSILLDKAKTFWKQFSQPPDPALFSRDRYKQVLRPWLAAFITTQQRLKDGASGDMQFSESEREETERQASSEQTEQEQAINSSQVEQLDRLIGHREFPEALFFIQTKTLQNAKSLYLQEKITHSCARIVRTVCFSPDGGSLLIPFANTIMFMVLDGNGKVIRKHNKDYNFSVEGLRFSPNGRSLLIGSLRNIMIMGLDGGDWVQKGRAKCEDFQKSVCFSPDSDSLVTAANGSVQIMGRDEKGNWVQNTEFLFYQVKAVGISPNGSSLAISNGIAIWIMDRDMEGCWVQNSMISTTTFTFVQSFCFSPDGGDFAISGWNGSTRKTVLIMRSDGKGKWVQNFVIPCKHPCSVCFSPDGHSLMLKTIFYSPHYSQVICFDRGNSRISNSGYFPHDGVDAVCISPDGGRLAIGRNGTTRVMGLGKGTWIEKACIPVEGNVSKVCFSPDSRRLAIILRFFGSECWSSQVKIYEIKASAKELTKHDK